MDGSSLVVAVVLNSIPKGTTQVLLRGKLTKVAYAIANTLCERDIKVRFNWKILTHYKAWVDYWKAYIAMFIFLFVEDQENMESAQT